MTLLATARVSDPIHLPGPPSAEVLGAPAIMSPATYDAFARYIERELGIKMAPQKRIMLQGRLQRRLRALSLPSFDAYRDLVLTSPAGALELVHFVDAVTTNKTDFYREAAHFAHLDGVLAARAGAGAGQGRFQLWCAGCSTGEEPYTAAMVLAERLGVRGVAGASAFAILATDISQRVLAIARQGIYPRERVAPLPQQLRQRHVRDSKDRSTGLVRVAPHLRERVSFHRLNFMQPDYGVTDQFDAIFFRNVAIYFDRPTQEAVVGKLCRSLRPGGHLYVGMSESLAGLDVPVTQVAPAVYRKAGARKS
jgi:chemotaxis protein methyltransferase CheR